MRLPALLFIIFISSCTGNSEVTRQLSGTDSLVINYFAPNSQDIVKSVSTADADAIRRVTEFVSMPETELYKCGYDGSLLFFEKGNQISDVAFKFSDETCRHFVLVIEGELVATKMNAQGAAFLKDLAGQ